MFKYHYKLSTNVNNTVRKIFVLSFLSVTLFTSCSKPTEILSSAGCTTKNATIIDGKRRMALIVGVGDYLDKNIPKLKGTVPDAKKMYQLLTSAGGYNFPPENVCLLLDSAATKKNIQEKYNTLLVQRAQPKDVVVLYFSSHGSQMTDFNNDELEDNLDETFLFYDATTEAQNNNQLVDDELYVMLAALHKKTNNITVIADLCNANTLMRGDVTSLVPRFSPTKLSTETINYNSNGIGDVTAQYLPKDLPGVVYLSASGDGASAYEKNGVGLFTDALLTVLSPIESKALSYAELMHRIRPLLAANSSQVAMAHGSVNKIVFDSESRTRPFALSVVTAGNNLILEGPPLPGLGVNTEFRIYSATATRETFSDPAKAKALIIVDKTTLIKTYAHVISVNEKNGVISIGDYAVLIRPSDQNIQITVRLDETGKNTKIPPKLAKQIRFSISNSPEVSALVKLTNNSQQAADYKLSFNHNKLVQIQDSQNRVLNIYHPNMLIETSTAIAKNLKAFAIQRALLQLKGEGGNDMQDQKSLKVELAPLDKSKQPACAKLKTWQQATDSKIQIVPLCYQYKIKVSLSTDAKKELLIGAIILSSDGSIHVASGGINDPLKPGHSRILEPNEGPYYGTVPLDIKETILVFGTQVGSPIPWDMYSTETKIATRSKTSRATLPSSPLLTALEKYLQPATRGSRKRQKAEDTSWTMSSVSFEVRANERFIEHEVKNSNKSKQYTLSNFDIKPYLSDNQDSILNKLLYQVDYQVRKFQKKDVDETNLNQGMDSAKFLWNIFTRAGLNYNKQLNKHQYIPTEKMIGKNSPMNNYFSSFSCDKTKQIADILVYRDSKNTEGHTVLVIDPNKRIAVSSNFWDGQENTDSIKKVTSNIQFHKIKIKKDFQRLYNKDIELKSCWRYTALIEEFKEPKNRPGLNHIEFACEDVCDSQQVSQLNK